MIYPPCFALGISCTSRPNFYVLFVLQRGRLVLLYEKKKEVINKSNFREIAKRLHVAEATAEIYGIDAFAAGAPIGHVWLEVFLALEKKNF